VKWFADPKKHEARSDRGYLITWAETKRGMFFNGYAPGRATRGSRKHIEASYDKDKVKAACDAHLAEMESKVA
jgi:hypothetical protein